MAIKLYRHEGDNGKWGYVDEAGNSVIEPKFEYAWNFTDDGIGLVAMNGQLGYINHEGVYIIDPQYYEASDFYYGNAIVQKNDEWMVIDTDGRKVFGIPLVGLSDYDMDDRSSFMLWNSKGNACTYSFKDKDWVEKIRTHFNY